MRLGIVELVGDSRPVYVSYLIRLDRRTGGYGGVQDFDYGAELIVL